MNSTKKGVGIRFDLPSGDTTAEPPKLVTGVMIHATQSQKIHELNALVEQLKTERGAQRIDPKRIRPSAWANRHADSFTGSDFDQLKAEITDAAGNVQPIKVRPLPLHDSREDGCEYEVVFGHRRHRACLELDISVLAVVESVDDRELWIQMERENRSRKDLSAWEQGMHYQRALDAGLFPSLRMLAAGIGRAPGDVSNALALARLPEEVVAAFASPNDLQFRHAKPLKDALERDAEGVQRLATELRGQRLPAAEVLAHLTGKSVRPSNTDPLEEGVRRSNTRHFTLGAGREAVVRTKGKRMVIEIDALPEGRLQDLAEALRRLMDQPGGD